MYFVVRSVQNTVCSTSLIAKAFMVLVVTTLCFVPSTLMDSIFPLSAKNSRRSTKSKDKDNGTFNIESTTARLPVPFKYARSILLLLAPTSVQNMYPLIGSTTSAPGSNDPSWRNVCWFVPSRSD
jgi:hypothetical protein